jgi:serine/threonine protein kinase
MTPKDFNPDYLVPGTRIGAYVVRTMLGQGGSSSVYEVESAEGHRFALKMCRYRGGAFGTSEWRVDQRYSRSIICLQLLKGRRNVAELYAHDRYPDPLHGHQYLVQELVPGSLLITDWVKRESPPLRKLVGAFEQLVKLCGVMANKGICHRDLKPANILVTPDGTPKVIDFESATCPHVKPVTRGAASDVPGTGGWQSPELCQAILEEQSKKNKEAFDFLPWGDLFSLGVVFYECLTGEHPFDTSLPEDMLLAEVAFETPIHPMRLSTAVPLGLNKVVMKLLERQPEARYREGAEVASDLRKLLENVKDERWDKPFKQPVPDEEEAPVLQLVPALVPPEPPSADDEKESEGPMPDTPSSEPHCVDTATSGEATSSTPSAEPDSADADVLLSDELETADPRGLSESALLDAEVSPTFPRVLDLGKAGAYTLEQRLGRGGMGEVYKARQVGAKGFSQLVAIKRVRAGQREWAERSFVDEARVLSLLHHENIARVYGFFESEGSPYLVMEYIEGQSLYTLLELARRKGHRFSESVACAVMAEVADALHYAHHVTDEAAERSTSSTGTSRLPTSSSPRRGGWCWWTSEWLSPNKRGVSSPAPTPPSSRARRPTSLRSR